MPALPDGAGLVVLINPSSGEEAQHPGVELAAAWPAARKVLVEPGTNLVKQLEAELDATESPVRALGAAGGDGTVAANRGLPLVVISAGTLNHFARDIGITTVSDAIAAVRDGSAVAVDLGGVRIDNAPAHWFVNTASLGGYPDLVELRKRKEARWGKWPAAALALIQVLRESDPLIARIDGIPRRVWLAFVGNGLYRPRGFAAAARNRLDAGPLDVRYIRADVQLSRTRFVIGALIGALQRSRTYVQLERTEVKFEVLGPPVALATDGEVVAEGRRFEFFTQPAALQVYRPDQDRGAP